MIELSLYGFVFVVLGAILYIADEKRGVRLYSRVWNFFHKDPINKDNLRGFVSGRSTRERLLPAAFVVLVSCFLLRYLGEHDLIMLALKGTFLMFPGLLVGFALMGFLRKNKSVVAGTEKALAALDRLEQSDVDITEVASGIVRKAEAAGSKVIHATKSMGGTSPKATAPDESAKATENETPAVSASPRSNGSLNDALRKFQNRG